MNKTKIWKRIFWALVFVNLIIAIIRALLHPYPDAGHRVPVVPHQQEQKTNEK